jgi:hypothetical protein
VVLTMIQDGDHRLVAAQDIRQIIRWVAELDNREVRHEQYGHAPYILTTPSNQRQYGAAFAELFTEDWHLTTSFLPAHLPGRARIAA